MPLLPDHPALAVIAPPRMARFRELLDLGPEEEIGADFTGWSKLVLLTADRAVLFPRDHTQVPALRREIAALEALQALGVTAVPRVHEVVEDAALSAYPVVVLDRMPGIPLASIVEALPHPELAALFSEMGRLAARWHALDPSLVPTLLRRSGLEESTTMAAELELDPQEVRAAAWALARARELEPVLVHGDLHEGQLLVDARPPHGLTGILDWQTARVDHPFVEFDLGEWGTALWRGHRSDFPALRTLAWTAYAQERGLPDDLAAVFEWHHACTHARRLLGRRRFPVAHGPGVVGTIADARAEVRAALRLVEAT